MEKSLELTALRSIRSRIEQEDPEGTNPCEQDCFHLADKAILEAERPFTYFVDEGRRKVVLTASHTDEGGLLFKTGMLCGATKASRGFWVRHPDDPKAELFFSDKEVKTVESIKKEIEALQRHLAALT